MALFRTSCLVCALAACDAGVCSPCSAEEPTGAALTGRFLFGGDAPAPDAVEVNKDQEVCGPFKLTDNTLIVAKDGGLANVVLWLDARSSGKEPPAVSAPTEPVLLDNDKCRFKPHVVLLQTGQELQVTNSDPIAHQATAFLNRNLPFNESVPAGGDPVVKTLEKPELLPAPVTCPIHPWMKAHLFVQDHPHMAVTGADGCFEIAGLPPGEWTFRIWQERTGFLKSDELIGNAPEGWDGPKLTIVVPEEGTVDLGDLTVEPAAFE
ncbi:MAG: carboxypeptidase regulatory-like domain-containing protein [Planctomycetota bacterium]